MPLPSNLAAHSLVTINEEGEVVYHFDKRTRSSHIVSRNVLDAPEAVQVRHSESNLAQVMEGAKSTQVCLMQTLISPIHLVEHMADYVPGAIASRLPELPPDLALYKQARETVARSNRAKDTFQHNHPFNVAKYFYYTQSNNSDSLALIEYATKFVDNKPGLKELVEAYSSLLKSPMGSATVSDHHGRELFLSSLEQLIILTLGGYSYGSCVSGKDRKAIELMHTDAMILFKLKYGRWPRFIEGNKEDRLDL